MKVKQIALLIAIFIMATACQRGSTDTETKPSEVKVVKTDGSYRLEVNGKSFFADGAGCEFGPIGLLSEYGANSFRTWRSEDGQRDAIDILNEAQKHGLMVLMGLEVGRERHGYDYSDTVWVQEQYQYLKGEVERLKDHPALLGWCIGNELNLQATDLAAYKAVNDISKMIHRIDGNHPTTTALSGIGKTEVDYLKQYCNDLDFLSIQMYGDIINLQQRIADAGWDGPYMVTEWGATGHWEVGLTDWNAPIEETSTEKAENIVKRYNEAIAVDPDRCLGSYAFLWGQKQERTPTWYGLVTESGETTDQADALQFLWTGEWPENRSPSVSSFTLNGMTATDNIKVKPGSKLMAVIDASDPENDSLSYRWEIIPESTARSVGGDAEYRPASILELTGKATEEFDVPEMSGAYRLLVYVRDNKKHAATANIPFYVE